MLHLQQSFPARPLVHGCHCTRQESRREEHRRTAGPPGLVKRGRGGPPGGTRLAWGSEELEPSWRAQAPDKQPAAPGGSTCVDHHPHGETVVQGVKNRVSDAVLRGNSADIHHAA